MAKSVTDVALESIREKIAPLEATLRGLRIAEEALLVAGAKDNETAEKPKTKRGRKKKAGLPETSATVNGGSLLTT